jgi:bacterioferritin-associated ferredoxin
MYVCLCKAVTDRQIRDAINGGCCSFSEVRKTLGVATECGKCGQHAKSIVKTAVRKTSSEPATV